MELLLVKFIKEHEDWSELLTKDPYNIKINKDDNYLIFKYNQLSSDFNNPIVRECRGIILEDKTFKPACVPFFKFANAEEEYSDLRVIDWRSASVQEKVDGSLMKVWFDGHWHVSTNGTIDASKASVGEALSDRSYFDVFVDALKSYGYECFEDFTNSLDTSYTYMFELVSPETRVVIDYPETTCYLIGMRNINTLKEIDYINTDLAKKLKVPKRYKLTSYEAVKEAANALPWDEEGYVVCDKYFHRVKIKSPEYVKAHHGRTNGNISLRRLIAIVLDNEVDEFLIYANEYAEKINRIQEAMNTFKNNINDLLVKLKPETFTSKKDYAMQVKEYPSIYQGFLFKYDKLEEAFSRLVISQWEKIVKFMLGEK